MNTYSFVGLVVLFCTLTWFFRGYIERRRTEAYVREKERAVREAKEILQSLRDGTRINIRDDEKPHCLFDLELISLREIGTTVNEVERLMARSCARWWARFYADKLNTDDSLDEFDRDLNALSTRLGTSEFSVEDLGVADIPALRHACAKREIKREAGEVISSLNRILNAGHALASRMKREGVSVDDILSSEERTKFKAFF